MQTDHQFLEFLLHTISEYLPQKYHRYNFSDVANSCLNFQSEYKQVVEENKKIAGKNQQQISAVPGKTEKSQLQNATEIHFYNRLLKHRKNI